MQSKLKKKYMLFLLKNHKLICIDIIIDVYYIPT